MIGQMIMVGFAGTEVNDPGVAAARDQLGEGTIGGVVLYPENIRSPQQITRAHRVPTQCAVVTGAVHRRRPGRRQGAAPVARNGHTLFSVGAQRRPEPELRHARQRRAALCVDGRGAGRCRLQPQFRTGGRSQSQSGKSGDRPARPELRRRSQHRHRARPRLHPRPSRRRDRHRRQAFSRPRLEPRRQPQGASPISRRAGGRSSSSPTACLPRTACSTR